MERDTFVSSGREDTYQKCFPTAAFSSQIKIDDNDRGIVPSIERANLTKVLPLCMPCGGFVAKRILNLTHNHIPRHFPSAAREALLPWRRCYVSHISIHSFTFGGLSAGHTTFFDLSFRSNMSPRQRTLSSASRTPSSTCFDGRIPVWRS